MVKGELRGQEQGFSEGAFFQEFPEIFRLFGGEFLESEIIQDDEVGIDHPLPELQDLSRSMGFHPFVEPFRDGEVENSPADMTGLSSGGLSEEGLADSRLPALPRSA